MTTNACELARRWGVFVLLAIGSVWAQQSKEASALPALPADVPANAERYSVTIMGNGVLYRPAELYSALGVEP
jgi:hypothetical protein